MEKGKLPSEKADEAAAQAKSAKQANEQRESEIKGAIARLSATEDGKIFLRWIMRECGFGSPYVAVDAQGKPNPELTLYQAFRLNLWWKVRKYLPIKQRIEVEDV